MFFQISSPSLLMKVDIQSPGLAPFRMYILEDPPGIKWMVTFVRRWIPKNHGTTHKVNIK